MANLSYPSEKRVFALNSANGFDWRPRLFRPAILLPFLALVLSTPGGLAAQSVDTPAQPVESAEAPALGAMAGQAAQSANAPAQPVESAEAPAEGATAGQAAQSADEPEQQEPESEHPEETWGVLDPGKGFLVGRSSVGELSLSVYALVRYLNQMPPDQTFTDHLGRERPVDTRLDIWSQRVLVWLTGWVGVPKLKYMIGFWALNASNDSRLFGNIGYAFNKHFHLWGGIYGNPSSRTMLGSHPYWLGHDRVMADEFFRAFFSQGIYANGEIVRGLFYNVSMGNSSSSLGNDATVLDRKLTYGASVWWMPTTGEFGPRGAYGDWEMHEKLATRFGSSVSWSGEQRYTPVGEDPGNTVLRLVDSVNLFETSSLAPDVTITFADYQLVAFDAGAKYRGFFLQTEFYWRTLNGFVADGPLPVSVIKDWGFFVQAAFFPIPKKLELYAATSQIYGDEDAGFGTANEYLGGLNYYIADTRNLRLNLQVINVNRSSVSSVFGYYTGGQVGTTVSLAASIFF